MDYATMRHDYSDYTVGNASLPARLVPNLKTGEGHGHFRPFGREKLAKDFHGRKRKRAKLAKQSRARNR